MDRCQMYCYTTSDKIVIVFDCRSLADDMKISWIEYWDFLGCAVDLRQPEGLSKLEDYIIKLEQDLKNTSGDSKQHSNESLVRSALCSLDRQRD